MVEGRQVIDNKIIINERDAYGQLVGFKMGLEKIVLFAGLFVALFAFGSTEIVESSTCTESKHSPLYYTFFELNFLFDKWLRLRN